MTVRVLGTTITRQKHVSGSDVYWTLLTILQLEKNNLYKTLKKSFAVHNFYLFAMAVTVSILSLVFFVKELHRWNMPTMEMTAVTTFPSCTSQKQLLYRVAVRSASVAELNHDNQHFSWQKCTHTHTRALKNTRNGRKTSLHIHNKTQVSSPTFPPHRRCLSALKIAANKRWEELRGVAGWRRG